MPLHICGAFIETHEVKSNKIKDSTTNFCSKVFIVPDVQIIKLSQVTKKYSANFLGTL